MQIDLSAGIRHIVASIEIHIPNDAATVRRRLRAAGSGIR
jgi:hypothetical protein